jgi:hypothetical protein
MSAVPVLLFLLTAALTAMETAIFAATGNAFSLGSAIFCGACAIFQLAMIVRHR